MSSGVFRRLLRRRPRGCGGAKRRQSRGGGFGGPGAGSLRVRRGEEAAEPVRELRVTRDRLLAGRLDLHRDGYGFVRPNGSVDRSDDLFIPPNELNGAMQGDEVLVDEAPPGRDRRRSGRIARVLNRRNPTVVGIFHYARAHRGSAWDDTS